MTGPLTPDLQVITRRLSSRFAAPDVHEGPPCETCGGGGRLAYADDRYGPCWSCRDGARSIGLPPRFANAQLDDFADAGALRGLLAWNFTRPGWHIHGRVGTGKTHAAAAICRAAAARGLIPAFIGTADFLERRRSAIDNPGTADAVRQLLAADLVVLDDAGGERADASVTGWATGELQRLVDALYVNEKLVIVTSNVTLRDLAAALGDRTASRLGELTRPLPMLGEDRRLRLVK